MLEKLDRKARKKARVHDPRNYVLDDIELMTPGHVACPGCGATMCMRMALKALGPNTVMIIPACCWAVIPGPFPYTALKVPGMCVAFETAAISATAVKAAYEMQGKTGINVVAWAGDGGTFDIGLQSLSGAAERNEDFIYVCYDNEAYMNTGIQRSGATPYGAWTTTTPVHHPKGEFKKNLLDIIAAHRIPYAATATVAFPDDLTRKLKKAASIRGSKLIHIFSPCPPGQKIHENQSIKLSRLIVETGMFPLLEVEYGKYWKLTHEPEFRPVEEYLGMQGRFRHLSKKDVEVIRRNMLADWKTLRAKIELSERFREEDRKQEKAEKAAARRKKKAKA
ncbi:MAG: pyruvate synthase subunit beta [Deltaproteobacteria bacterium]|nr:pyruvate synthase subunit beta [Deltaproteobacteria bacterium]